MKEEVPRKEKSVVLLSQRISAIKELCGSTVGVGKREFARHVAVYPPSTPVIHPTQR